ncbi:hypothetical protein [Nocardia xishanensis]|uniref:hypothetical protein n=1 Tax=Nocardia xishanensis TaxID=238964 RepID=UPI0034423A9D
MTVDYEDSQIRKKCVTDNPWGHSHEELRDAFQPLNPTEANAARDDYAKIATGWNDAVALFAARIKRSSESAWDGTAAQAARQSIANYATDALNFTPALQAMSSRVDDVAAAVTRTKNGMPDVVNDPQSWWNPGDWFDGNPESDAEASAQQYVKDNFVDKVVAADAQVPVLPTPKDPVNSTNTLGDGTTPNPTVKPTGTNPEGTTPTPSTPTTQDPASTNPASTNPQNTETPSTSPQSTNPTTPTTGTPTTGTPTTGTPTTPASATPTTGTPTTGTPRPGAPGSGTPQTGTPGTGKSVSGNPGTVTAPGTSASSKPAGTGRNGMAGMPGMGAGAGRGKSDDDSDHSIPDYLINAQNADELIGDMPFTVPDGVIGGHLVPPPPPQPRSD